MCGRFTLRTPAEDVADVFHLPAEEVRRGMRQLRFNIAPTQQVLVVREDRPHHREVALLRWGLVPSWVEEPAAQKPLINARAETVATKPSFRNAFRARRCLIPADGFYEWPRAQRSKQPYYVRLKDERPFAFAGLWEHWRHGGEAIDSCTIVTTEANELVRPLHNRMPVILAPEQFEQWLDVSLEDTDGLQGLLRPYPAERMVTFPVMPSVNSPRFDDPRCIEPVEPPARQGTLFD